MTTRRARTGLSSVVGALLLATAAVACGNTVQSAEPGAAGDAPATPGPEVSGGTGAGQGGAVAGTTGVGTTGPATTGHGGTGSGWPGDGDGGSPVDCSEFWGNVKPDLLPCVNEGQLCVWPWECGECTVSCNQGAWNGAECHETAPDCSGPAPQAGSSCHEECSQPCSYTVETPCGPETVQPSCGPVGWSYPVECETDCTAYQNAGACGSDPACVWIGGCDATVTQCVRNAGCLGQSCPNGQTCVEIQLDMCNPSLLQCESCWDFVKLCMPS